MYMHKPITSCTENSQYWFEMINENAPKIRAIINPIKRDGIMSFS